MAMDRYRHSEAKPKNPVVQRIDFSVANAPSE